MVKLFTVRAGLALALAAIVITAHAQSQANPGRERAGGETPMIVLDAHQDCLRRVLDRGDTLAEALPDAQGHFADWRAGGVNVVWFAAWINPRKYRGEAAVRRTLNLIEALRRQETMFPQVMKICDTVAECREAAREGYLVALVAIEGGIALNNDLSMLQQYRDLGVRRMNLTWKGNLDWAGSSQPLKELNPVHQPNKGLTDFGRAVVREMNRLGILVDLSHSSDQTFYDAIEESRVPVILSHSNARALADHPRNISDDMLRALRDNGGVIGINFYRDYLVPNKPGERNPVPNVETVLDQIDHVVKVAGIDHVGIGSDWDGDITPARGLESAAGTPRIFEGMRKRGYSDVDIRKFAGENFLRVLEAAEQAAEPRRR